MTGRLRPLSMIAGLLLALSGLTKPVAAHPHIWIQAKPSLQMDKRRIVAVTQEWTFDAFFSAALIKDFDKNGDGKFSADEIAAMRQNAFAALKDFDYFTHVRVDGKAVKLTEVRDFSARIEKGKIVYRFTLALPVPVDPRKQKAAFLFYDHTYYVDVALAKTDAVSLVNGAGCRVGLSDDKANPIYFGLVVPKMATVACADG